MQKQSFVVSTEKFDGPLDVLLELIEKEKLDITMISIARITDSFLNYIKENTEVIEPRFVASFLVIASRLILIKSRVLLPFLKFTEEEEEEMGDLEHRLVEYKKFKEAAKVLKALASNGKISFSREQFLGQAPVFFPPKNIGAENLRQIMDCLIKEFENLKIIIPEEHVKISVSLQNIISNLKQKIMEAKEMVFSDFKKDKTRKIEVILAFLAILEMVKGQIVITSQEYLFGEIKITQNEPIENIIQ